MTHHTELRVRWGDTDAGGLIYFPRYFHFAIVALNEYFAPAFEGGHPMEALRRESLVLPAVDASASFESPLRAGDEVVVETTVTALGDASMTVAFELTRSAAGPPVASLEVTFVLVDDAFEATSLLTPMRECVDTRGDGAAT